MEKYSVVHVGEYAPALSCGVFMFRRHIKSVADVVWWINASTNIPKDARENIIELTYDTNGTAPSRVFEVPDWLPRYYVDYKVIMYINTLDKGFKKSEDLRYNSR